MTLAACPLPPQPQVVREVRLYGALGRRFGRVHRLAVETAAEAVQALSVVLPGFERYFLNEGPREYRVWAGKTNLGEEDLLAPVGAREVIRLVPVVRGAKKAGIGTIIVAAVIWIVATALLVVTDGASAPLSSAMYSTSYAMLIGGVIQMLSPQRSGQDSQAAENEASYNFGGAVNVTTEGGPVPLGYGRMIVGSVVISGGISTDDLSPPPPAPPWTRWTMPADQQRYPTSY